MKSSRELELHLFNLLIWLWKIEVKSGNQRTSKVETPLGKRWRWQPPALAETTFGLALQKGFADQTGIQSRLDFLIQLLPVDLLEALATNWSLSSVSLHSQWKNQRESALLEWTPVLMCQADPGMCNLHISPPSSPHCTSKFESWMGHRKWNRVWRFTVITCWHFPTSLTYHMI